MASFLPSVSAGMSEDVEWFVTGAAFFLLLEGGMAKLEFFLEKKCSRRQLSGPKAASSVEKDQ